MLQRILDVCKLPRSAEAPREHQFLLLGPTKRLEDREHVVVLHAHAPREDLGQRLQRNLPGAGPVIQPICFQ